MTCSNCGSPNLDNATICANCGRPLTAAYAPPPPRPGGVPAEPIKNYLVQSILVTLCCCLPLGIVAIIFASQVNSKLAAGDYAGAQAASASAKKWCLIALILGLVANVILFFIYGIAAFQSIREASGG